MSEIALAAGIVELLVQLEAAHVQAKQAKDAADRQAAIARMDALFEQIKARRATLEAATNQSTN